MSNLNRLVSILSLLLKNFTKKNKERINQDYKIKVKNSEFSCLG